MTKGRPSTTPLLRSPQANSDSRVSRKGSYSGKLSPADKVVLTYLAIITALVLASSQRVGLWWAVLSAHAIIVALIVAMAKLSRPLLAPPCQRIMGFIRGWYAVLLIPLMYKELTYLIPLVNPGDLDWQLAGMDYRMLGVHPTLWLERFNLPLVNELLLYAYVTFFFWPVALGAVVWRKGRFATYHFLLFVFVLGFYLSYLGYLTVPALGPRFTLAEQQAAPLTGVLFFDTIQVTLNRLEQVTRDCFPSGHTALTLLVVYYARRFHRRTFWVMLIPAIGLVMATVLLRYHYLVDVLAGALLALAVGLVARPLYQALGGATESAGAR
ncbi:MAG: phosphatase PAP2 family protein [Gammaproteobacteria bacterium]